MARKRDLLQGRCEGVWGAEFLLEYRLITDDVLIFLSNIEK